MISQAIVPPDQRGVITRSGPRTVQSHQRAALLINKDTQASAPPGSNQQILPAIPIKIVRADYWPAATRAMGQSRLPSPVIEWGLGVNRLRPALPLDKLWRRPCGWLFGGVTGDGRFRNLIVAIGFKALESTHRSAPPSHLQRVC